MTPDTVISEPTPLDIVRRLAVEQRAAERYRRRVAALLPALRQYADALKQAIPDWLTARSAEAQLVREIEALLAAPARAANVEAGRTFLTSNEAATRLGYLKPDGRIKDSFYRHVAKKIGVQPGTRWRFPLVRVEAYERGELT